MITITCPKCHGQGGGCIFPFKDHITCPMCGGLKEVLPQVVPPDSRHLHVLSKRS